MGIYRQSRAGYSDHSHLETLEMIKMTRMHTMFSFLNMNKPFLLKSSVYWKVISEYKGGRRRISDIKKCLKTKFLWLPTILLVLKHQNKCISNSSVFQKLLLEQLQGYIQVYECHLHIGQN
jgi:hypothetical protein